jgi:hypothetical protein
MDASAERRLHEAALVLEETNRQSAMASGVFAVGWPRPCFHHLAPEALIQRPAHTPYVA